MPNQTTGQSSHQQPIAVGSAELGLDELEHAASADHGALERLTQALKTDPTLVASAAAQLSATDAARVVLHLKPKQARIFLHLLPDAPSLALLHECDPSVRERLLDDQELERIASIVARLKLEDAADFLADAPAPLVAAALAQYPDVVGLRAALDYREETAGSVMRRRLVAAPEDWTISMVIDEIRACAERIDRVHAVYVIDGGRRLLGYLNASDLLLQPAGARVADVMHRDVVSVSANDDREDLARLAGRENLPVLPVVDAAGVLVGMVTPQELRAIDRAEADEDIKLLSGLAPESSAADGPLRIVPRRLPWLAAGLLGAGTAALVIGSYEDALTEAAILASLIPIVMSLAGNAGIQAATVSVQAMSTGSFWFGDLGNRILREIGGAMLNGSAVGLITALGIMGLSQLVEIDRPANLALTAALTLVAVTIQASAIGAVIPLLLARLKFDPAVATGVFITTGNDVVGVLIFFLVATTFYI
jgi:magnesium transporter